MTPIEEQIAQIDWKNHDQVINFYEKNSLYFDNADVVNDKEKISQFIDIKLHYANSLFDKSHFDKVLTIVDQARRLLDKLDTDHWNYGQSDRHIRFLTGMVLGHQKRFKDSYLIFKQLIKEDTDHHHYKVWYQHSKTGLYNWIFNLLFICGVALFVVDMIFSILLKISLPIKLASMGWVIMITSIIIQTCLKQYFKAKAPNNG